jgi:P4 family phage/plasmid primase-like protien
VQLWLQRWFGYCLTASFQDRVFACFWGEGANGKSVLTKLFRWLYGDYAATLQFASLLDDRQRRGSEATPDLAKLPGVRAVFAGEPKKGARLDDGLIKQVTGGDEINVRKLHHDFFDLQPTFKVTLAFNNKPIVRDDSQGMWSRVMLVPFQATIPESRQDKSLLDKLKAEGPGVLNWALDGFRMWREQGLAPPEAILGASAEWRSESDQIGLFLEMATVRDPAEKVSAGALFACYEGWARAMEVRPVSQTLFGRQLTKRQILASRDGEKRYRIGVKVVYRYYLGLAGAILMIGRSHSSYLTQTCHLETRQKSCVSDWYDGYDRFLLNHGQGARKRARAYPLAMSVNPSTGHTRHPEPKALGIPRCSRVTGMMFPSCSAAAPVHSTPMLRPLTPSCGGSGPRRSFGCVGRRPASPRPRERGRGSKSHGSRGA